jgi:mRNA interferase YafQ
MLTIKYASRFKRDYRREKSGNHGKKLDALIGTLNDCRDCHIKPDLILIYRKTHAASLELVRLGSHSELGL